MNPAYKRFIQGVGSNLLGPANTIFLQLLGIPLFLTYWGLEVYGEWLLLIAVTQYLSILHQGSATVAANSMTMYVGEDNRKAALSIYHSALAASGLIFAVGTAVIMLGVFFLDFEQMLNLGALGRDEYRWILLVLLLNFGANQFSGIEGHLFRCESQYPKGQLYTASFTFLGNIAVFSVLPFGGGPLEAAIAQLVISLIGLFVIFTVTRKLFAWVNFVGFFASLTHMRELIRPAAGYIAYGLSNAIPLQISVTLVGIVLGPSMVALFSTVRTLSRLILIPGMLMTNSAWPEFSTALSRGEKDLTRQLFRRVIALTFWVSVIVGAGMLVVSEPVYMTWTKNEIPFDFTLFAILLFLAVFSGVLNTVATLPVSVNKHEMMAVKFILVAAASIAVGYGFLSESGLISFACVLSADTILRCWIAMREAQGIIDDDPKSIVKYVMFHSKSDIVGACARLLSRRKQGSG